MLLTLLAAMASVHAQSQACAAPRAAYTVPVPGRPFGVQELPSQQAAFVSVNPETPREQPGIAVLRCRNGRFALDRFVPLSIQPTGLAMTPDGRMLVVADDAFAAFVRTSDAVAGRPSVDGFIKLSGGDIEDDDAGSVFASVSPDGRFAFISDEQAAAVTVIDIAKAQSSGYARTAIVGNVEVGNAPITSTFSDDGRTMYVTAEIARRKYGFPKTCREEGAPADAEMTELPGAVTAIDVAKAETDPASAVLGYVATGCATVRLSLSRDARFAWATNRGSNTLTLLDASAIATSSPNATLATMTVGSNPVPVLATSDGRYVLVGNTNRFGPGGTQTGTVSVVDAASHRVVATFEVGVFPREFDRGAGTTVFLANNRSDSVTVFDDRSIADCVSAANAACLK